MASFSTRDKHGLMILGVAGMCILGLMLVPLFLKDGNGSAVDPDTLCPRSGNYGHTVILVDKTDPFTPTQQHVLQQVIASIRDHMAVADKLSIYILDDTNYVAPQPAFALCNPGSGRDANPIYQNPQKVERVFRERFGQPLERILKPLMAANERAASPIMEMIREISTIDDFGAHGDSGPNAPRRRLVIFSDMLQNMADYSHYRTRADFETFRTSQYYYGVHAPLSGVEVEIYYLVRPHTRQLQTRGHILFWEQYFRRAGAVLNFVRPVP